MAVSLDERQMSRAALAAENARLRDALARAGIDPGVVASLSRSRAEVAAVREEMRRARAEADEVETELVRSEGLVGELRAVQADLRTILDAVPVGILLAEAPSGRITLGNGRIEELLGHPPIYAADVPGYAAYVARHPDGRVVAPDEWPLARIVGGTVERDEIEMRYLRPDGRETWLSVTGEAVKAADGTTRGAVIALRCIDDRKAAEAAQDILNRELSHRLKNTLALVQSIAAQTLRNATSLDAAQDALAARLIVLGKAHDILLAGHTDSACVSAVVQGALALHEDTATRFRTEGPTLQIGPSTALSLGLMLHELATNATKYGALSNAEGWVRVAWRVEGEGAASRFSLDWSEHGGPPVSPPARKGFGSRLIERGFAGGQVTTTYRPDGLACSFTVPLDSFQVGVQAGR